MGSIMIIYFLFVCNYNATLTTMILISAKNEFLIADASLAMKALTVVFNYLNDQLTHSKPALGEGNSSLSCKRSRGKDLAIKLIQIN